MVEEYILYQSLVYIIRYLPKLAVNMKVPRIWDVKSIKKIEEEVLDAKG
jgi:hypothetical protein